MSRRRWLFLAATLEVLTASGLVCWTRLHRAGSGASVALVFVGYTNETVAVFRPLTVRHGTSVLSTGTNGMAPSLAVMTTARMLVTNNGTVPVKFWNNMVRPSSLYAAGFVFPGTISVSGQVLRPGESMSFTVSAGNFGSRWWTEVAYHPHRLAERVYGRVWDSANPTVQKFIARLVRGPSLAWVDSGWITNQAPMVRVTEYMPRALSYNGSLTQAITWAPSLTTLSAQPDRSLRYWRSDVILWPAVPERRCYNITAPPVLAPIDLPPLRPVQPELQE